MKTRIIYDSVFGNTEKIAMAIFHALSPYENTKACFVGDITMEDLRETDLLIVGSPTRGFSPTPAIRKLIKQLPAECLHGVEVAAFDTRLALGEIKSSALRFIVKTGGYAAKPIASRLIKKGGNLIVPPEGFYVSGEEGPLLDTELKRAADWTKELIRLTVNKTLQKVNS